MLACAELSSALTAASRPYAVWESSVAAVGLCGRRARALPRDWRARSSSYMFWRFIQKSAAVPKYRARGKAVSAEMARLPAMIWEMRLAGTRVQQWLF